MPNLFLCSVLAALGGVTPVMALLAVLLVALVLLSLVLTKLRQSLLIGYFACGVAAANSGLLEWLGGDALHERMNVFADTGVALLMFTLGIEFSLNEFKHLRKAALLGGGVQVGLTALLAGTAGWFCGLSGAQATVLAVSVALSSTAVSMKTFQDLAMPASPAARASLAIAIFQDLLVIAFMLLLPILLNEGGGQSLLITGEFVALFLVFAWLLGRYLIPRLLLTVSRTQSRELFTLTVLALCVSVACLASLMGLSLALGAFVAGLVVSGSIYSHRVLADVLPFKDLFLTLFFVTVGLTIDLSVLARYGWWVLAATAVLLLVKGTILLLTCRILEMPARSALLCSAALASTGEFSLVLMARSRDSLAWDNAFYQVFVLSTALSMALVPAMMRKAPVLSEWLERSFLRKSRKAGQLDPSIAKKTKSLSQHAILCGYGVVGQQLHQELSKAGVACLVIELNVDTVRNLKRQGVPVLFADATHRETWELARVQSARLVAFTFPDAAGAINSLAHVRDHAPRVPVIARVKFAGDADAMREAGATHVVFDEVESAAAAVRVAREEFEIAVD